MTNKYPLDLKIIQNLLKKQERRYLNLKILENKPEEYYILSYYQLNPDIEKPNIDYIESILKQYTKVLNDKADKTITLEQANIKDYKQGKSFILDYLNQNWEGYKAGESLIKYIVTKDKKNVFDYDMNFVKDLINTDDYKLIMFFIDKLKLTFNIEELRKLINSIETLDQVIRFISLDIEEISAKLEAYNIGTITDKKGNIKKLRNAFLEKEYLVEDNLETIKEYILMIFISLCMERVNISGDKDIIMYNRKEIIKSNKTETKIEKTFSNDIFHIALFEPNTEIS